MRTLTREERAIYEAERRAIGDNIRRLREEVGLTQADLGRLIGCSQQNIFRFESAGQSPPHYRLVQIAVELGHTSTIPLRVVRDAGGSPIPKAQAVKRKKKPARAK